MEITTKELRIQPGRIIEHVVQGQEVIVTYRGKPLVKIVPILNQQDDTQQEDIFGLWKDHEDKQDVEKYVRNIRKKRTF